MAAGVILRIVPRPPGLRKGSRLNADTFLRFAGRRKPLLNGSPRQVGIAARPAVIGIRAPSREPRLSILKTPGKNPAIGIILPALPRQLRKLKPGRFAKYRR